MLVKTANNNVTNQARIAKIGYHGVTSPLAGDFLMTYDDAIEVRKVAQSFGFDTKTVAMKITIIIK